MFVMLTKCFSLSPQYRSVAIKRPQEMQEKTLILFARNLQFAGFTVQEGRREEGREGRREGHNYSLLGSLFFRLRQIISYYRKADHTWGHLRRFELLLPEIIAEYFSSSSSTIQRSETEVATTDIKSVTMNMTRYMRLSIIQSITR